MAERKKAQVSAEFLAVLAISMVIITIVLVVAQQQMGTVQKQKDASDAQNSLLDLSSAAKEVYAQGEGSKKQVFVQLPGGYNASRSFVGNRSIQLTSDGTDYVALEDFNVRGYLPNAPGKYWVWVTSEGSRVRIGIGMMALSKNRIYVVMPSNSTSQASFSVTNAWPGAITVNTITAWSAPNVSMSGVPSSFPLAINAANTITLQFTAGPTTAGFYTGQIELDANDGNGATESVIVPVTVYVIGYSAPARDVLGPVIIDMYQSPTPALELLPLTIWAVGTDNMTGSNVIKNCEISTDSANWTVMDPTDGTYDSVTETAQHNYTSGFSLGTHIVRTRCADALNNTGPIAYYYFNVTPPDTLGPIVTSMTHTDYPTTLSNISVGGTATDFYTGGSNVSVCNVKLDSGGWHAASAVNGTWNTSINQEFTYNAGSLPVGFHQAYYQCTDSRGNVGGIYNDSFGVVDVDLMLVIDRSGSMAWNVTNATSDGVVSASSTGWSWVKNLTVTQTNGNTANLSVETKASASGCMVSYEARLGSTPIANGNRTSTSYGTQTFSVDVAGQSPPYVVSLWLKRNASGCTAYNQGMSLQQAPTKISAAQTSAKTFLDISGNSTYAGLVSFSTGATTDKQLAVMTPANLQALKNSLDALTPSGSTCLECGLDNAADELTSARGRANATRVIVMLTDGVGNVGDSISGAVYCRNKNITVYTIGFGNDVDETELTNIGLLTHGDYYYAPNAETLTEIFRNIGK